MIKLMHAILLFFPLVFSCSESQAAGGFYAQQKPDSNTVTLNLHEASLIKTLRLITNRLGKNLILDSKLEDKTVNMYLNEIHPFDAYMAILKANNLVYQELNGNVFFVSKPEKITTSTVVKNITCKYANAVDLQAILKDVIVSEFGNVMADKRTNTLIIKESPQILAKMASLIAELDRPNKQVYIQAEIVEASSKNDTQVGVEWLWDSADYKSLDGKIGTNFGLRPAESIDATGAETTTSGAQLPLGDGLGIGILNADIDIVLHALSEVNNINLLSRPRVVTMDNQEAVIEVGDQIPFKVLNEFGVTSFEFKDATIQLTVKPHVIDSSYIILEVSPKADFQNGVTADGTPIIATRKASTKVKIRDGQTIVIGGLIRDSQTTVQRKVPILGDIPILGNLFKSNKSINLKTELLVFITPMILPDDPTLHDFKEDFELKDKVQKKLK